MAKRGAIVDMGRHKPLGSSWRSMDTQAYSRSYEPETRPEFQCFVGGQANRFLSVDIIEANTNPNNPEGNDK